MLSWLKNLARDGRPLSVTQVPASRHQELSAGSYMSPFFV
jgi:hypothetical protein